VLAPHSFATGMDWLLDRTVESCSIGVVFGQSSFTDLDFADDVFLLAELLELLVLILETTASEAAVVEEFVYLGSLIHSSTGSTCDISRRSAITRAAMQSLENQIWRSMLAISTKLKLYNTCILPISLYGSDCWAISKTDARKIDALDQWCLRMLLGINGTNFVRNDDVRRLTKQPKLTAIIQSRRLTLFWHIMHKDDNADAKRILLASPPADWRRQLGRPRITWLSTVQQDLKQHQLTLLEAADLDQNCALWRMMSTYGTTQS